jgi:hypothetical protein
MPARGSTGRVHSVFAHACNIAFDDGLVTVAVAPVSAGPTTLVLDAASATDLRTLFRADESIEWGDGSARSSQVTLDFAQARRWHRARARRALPLARVAANLDAAVRAMRRRDCGETSSDRLRAALSGACRAGNPVRASRLTHRMLGLGPGSTPAGDDFLVGLCAGLDARLGRNPRQQRVRDRIVATVCANLSRTTTISAHMLRLAAAGDFNDDILAARDALVSSVLRPPMQRALARLWSAGASSGAAACQGLRAGLAARLTQCR